MYALPGTYGLQRSKKKSSLRDIYSIKLGGWIEESKVIFQDLKPVSVIILIKNMPNCIVFWLKLSYLEFYKMPWKMDEIKGRCRHGTDKLVTCTHPL